MSDEQGIPLVDLLFVKLLWTTRAFASMMGGDRPKELEDVEALGEGGEGDLGSLKTRGSGGDGVWSKVLAACPPPILTDGLKMRQLSS